MPRRETRSQTSRRENEQQAAHSELVPMSRSMRRKRNEPFTEDSDGDSIPNGVYRNVRARRDVSATDEGSLPVSRRLRPRHSTAMTETREISTDDQSIQQSAPKMANMRLRPETSINRLDQITSVSAHSAPTSMNHATATQQSDNAPPELTTAIDLTGTPSTNRSESHHPTEPTHAASDGSLLRGLEEDLTCPICSELLVDPLHGHCGHAFCAVCLGRWAVEGVRFPGQAAKCPLCKASLPACAASSAVAHAASADPAGSRPGSRRGLGRSQSLETALRRVSAARGSAAEAAYAARRAERVAELRRLGEALAAREAELSVVLDPSSSEPTSDSDVEHGSLVRFGSGESSSSDSSDSSGGGWVSSLRGRVRPSMDSSLDESSESGGDSDDDPRGEWRRPRGGVSDGFTRNAFHRFVDSLMRPHALRGGVWPRSRAPAHERAQLLRRQDVDLNRPSPRRAVMPFTRLRPGLTRAAAGAASAGRPAARRSGAFTPRMAVGGRRPPPDSVAAGRRRRGGN